MKQNTAVLTSVAEPEPGRSRSQCEDVKAKTSFLLLFSLFLYEKEPEPVKNGPGPQHWVYISRKPDIRPVWKSGSWFFESPANQCVSGSFLMTIEYFLLDSKSVTCSLLSLYRLYRLVSALH